VPQEQWQRGITGATLKAMAMFIDEARIRVKAGDGGNGCVAFRREKVVPEGRARQGPSRAANGAGRGGGTSSWSRVSGTIRWFTFALILSTRRSADGTAKDPIAVAGKAWIRF